MSLIKTIDGNEAAAHSAFMTNEVICIYPITPSSTMAELSDDWASKSQKNIWEEIPRVVEMQSEAGAAGAVHGSLQGGALTTTFTASQGLLLKIPNMFKIAGELTPSVFHIAARCLASHALSIFGDHSDVMHARTTGFAMLSSTSVQEAQDMAMIAQMSTLKSRVPFLHFFDGFRTSHEVNKINYLSLEDARALIDEDLVIACHNRGLTPENPTIRGTAQNPDIFFQAREACNPYYDAVPGIVKEAMDRFAKLTGRQYHIFEYYGAADADRVMILMGSAVGAAHETVDALNAKGEKTGVLTVHLYRPFDAKAILAALPKTVKSIAVLDRTKEAGSLGEPLYLDVVAAVTEGWREIVGTNMPKIVGGRYGLSSKEFTPAMAKAVLDELKKDAPKNHFTIGITDDLTKHSIPWDPSFITEDPENTRAIFFGLGSDGTVGANKNSIKIIGENTPMFAQGYFVYDSKKSGGETISHLRFDKKPIKGAYLIQRANFIAVHQFGFVEKREVLANADMGATLLLNCPYPAEEAWNHIPAETQKEIIEKKIRLFVIDAGKVAESTGMGTRINTVMQACFFKLSGVLPEAEAIEKIKEAAKKTYSKKGEAVVQKNYAAIDAACENLHEVKVPTTLGNLHRVSPDLSHAPEYVKKIMSKLMKDEGETLPTSVFDADGHFPTATTKWEKRGIAREIPIWDPNACIGCAFCSISCPHAAIRIKTFLPEAAANAPASFTTRDWKGKEVPAGSKMRIQVYADDCTGCGVCVAQCPAAAKGALKMEYRLDHLEEERKNLEFFDTLPYKSRTEVDKTTIKGSQLIQPLFEFSGACAGCGETPYVKLVSQLFGDRMVVANATGCSSIYGGNLPSTPWSQDEKGHGPAWANSLFEDNAEFGLGIRLALDQRRDFARDLLKKLSAEVGDELVKSLCEEPQKTDADFDRVRTHIAQLKAKLAQIDSNDARMLMAQADNLLQRSLWIVGGDGWAYDIGYGGLDHIFSLGRNVNILVLDTEVYSNTGGQASKSTSRGAIAKFAAGGKPGGKKDLGQFAMAYGNVYVAQIALGADRNQALKALAEAEAYEGTSLIIAYSPCIAHGINMMTTQDRIKDAVKSGYWPMYRFQPTTDPNGKPFHLDSKEPTMPFKDFALQEARFAQLQRTKPELAEHLFSLAQRDIDERIAYYKQLVEVQRYVNE